jgi:hypothetical protein
MPRPFSELGPQLSNLQTWQAQQSMARQFGVSKTRVNALLRELEAAGKGQAAHVQVRHYRGVGRLTPSAF